MERPSALHQAAPAGVVFQWNTFSQRRHSQIFSAGLLSLAIILFKRRPVVVVL